MKFVVRAGGAGTRLWPFSRRRRPKQFHAMTGPRSMIQEAVARVRPLASAEDLFVSTGEATAGLVREHLPDLGPGQLIVEPALRNTGPAVGLECALLEGRYPGCVVASLGSDHYIGDAAEFRRLLKAAEAAVEEHPGFLLTIGVVPTRPETGYGYIRKGEVLCSVDGRTVYRVPEFREKPDAEAAAQYVESGGYLWNSNMFVWKAAAVLELFARFEPEIFAALAGIREAAAAGSPGAAIAGLYPGLPSISIDHAVLERAPRVATLEGEFAWGDVGSWAALTDVLPADADGNLLSGNVLAIDARGVTAYGGREKLIALVGVEDLVVVDTGDALLVCRKDQAQRVKEVLDRLEAGGDLSRYM